MAKFNKIHLQGTSTLIVAALLLLAMQGTKYYLDLRQDRSEANKLMDRELRIAELSILSDLEWVEILMDGMETNVRYHYNSPTKLYNDTYNTMLESDFIQATAVGFKPYFIPEQGRWFEPRCVRRDNKLVNEQIGGPDHDYFEMEWYKLGLTKKRGLIKWTKPYFDHTQDDVPLMSLTRALNIGKDKDSIVGVMCIDVTLVALKKELQAVKPYKGSVCQLLDEQGALLVSSDNVALDSSKYFIGVKDVGKHGLLVKLACPKSEIYGESRMRNVFSLTFLLVGILVVAYIIQRSYKNIIRLNAAKQKQHDMKNEMRIAHNIQMNILRRDFPDNIAATLLPMQEVGGDLYDFYQRDEVLYFIIGDVSGKGVSAAMMMSSTVNLFRMAAQHYSMPAEIVNEINGVVSERNPSMMFVTAFVGKLDMRHGLLTYCNAGHNPPVINGQLLNADPDIPIGYDTGYEFRQRGAIFPEGSRIVLYTDGITEIRNTEQEFMGTKRLVSIVRKHQKESSRDQLTHIMQQTMLYALGDDTSDDDSPLFISDEEENSVKRHDDMTLMCIINDKPVQSPSLVISNNVGELTRVKALLREYCQCIGCDKRVIRKITLAIEEALVNVINYAYPEGQIGLIEIDILAVEPTEAQQGDITVIISDSGKPFNPLDTQAIDVEQAMDDRQIGGLGIHLYQQIMDSVTYSRTDKNILTLTKYITANGN